MSRAMLGPAGGQAQGCEPRGPRAQRGRGGEQLGGPRCPGTHTPRPARTFKVEVEGEAVGHHGPLATHHAVTQEGLGVSAQSLGGLRAAHAHPHAGVRPSE